MPRLHAEPDRTKWVPVTDSLGFRGRRHRKAAIRMLLAQAKGPGAAPSGAGGFTAWAMSQAVPFLMRKAGGRVLVWVWKADPELVVAMAQVQTATPQLRAARASLPIEYDDSEKFRGTYLGIGEKLSMPLPPGGRLPFATYTWDLGSHFVSVTAVCSDRERFGTVIGAVDELARGIRIIDDLTVGESATVLRLDPA
ncbi:hypothetical protein [Agromyces laixinhei]|uniref:hypothetical protein n=1 Tax=Agromyces laixinhei TaxID=2585717 RepID=UPI001116E7A5|nr:hypothetical protein [Agromyces laixinhei]